MAEAAGGRGFHGLVMALRGFGGARAVRVVHPSGQRIGEHVHDWPSLTLPLLGGCTELYDGGETMIAGPSAVLHPAGAAHADVISGDGMETVSLQFDPAWLGLSARDFAFDRTRCWSGGEVAAAARRLSAAWVDPALGEADLRAATAAFLRCAQNVRDPKRAPWIARVLDELARPEPASTHRIAHALDLHPAWLARAYRAATGEGIAESLRRKRVERATALLRATDLAPAEIALAAGFCDQSHMNRSVRALIGRTPLDVRAERAPLAALARAA